MIRLGAYLDASAFVKLAIRERESKALATFLADWPRRTSSALLRTEATRALRPFGSSALARATAALERVELLWVNDDLLEAAGLIDPLTVRTLDAIHLATANAARDELGVLVTYDRRMIEGAEHLGLPTSSPA